jgi:hypothetical protein
MRHNMVIDRIESENRYAGRAIAYKLPHSCELVSTQDTPGLGQNQFGHAPDVETRTRRYTRAG